MAQPTINDVQQVSPILTNMLVGFKQADSRFVASRVFPSVPVDKDSGTYYVITQKYWFLDEMKTRAPGGKFARGGYGVETDTYLTLQWGLEHAIPDENKANSQLPMALESLGAQWLAQQSLIRKERAWATDFMAASVWTTQDNNATTNWSDFSAGDPVKDIRTGKRAISQLTGMTPNRLIMGEVVWDALCIHPDMVDRLKYTQAATAQSIEAAVASILQPGPDSLQILVGAALYNTVNEGTTASYSPIIDDDALLLYVAPNPNMFSATAGLTFTWTPGGGDGVVGTYRDQSSKSDILQSYEQWDQKKVSAALGAIWLSVA